MNLIDHARSLLPSRSNDLADATRLDLERAFVEAVTFAEADEIVDMVRQVLSEDWIGFPVWARNLSYRLACLLRPGDAALRREAAADLRSVGPDWDDIAARLEEDDS
jgi:hypothetical protein